MNEHEYVPLDPDDNWLRRLLLSEPVRQWLKYEREQALGALRREEDVTHPDGYGWEGTL